jgi:hypothetical protein
LEQGKYPLNNEVIGADRHIPFSLYWLLLSCSRKKKCQETRQDPHRCKNSRPAGGQKSLFQPPLLFMFKGSKWYARGHLEERGHSRNWSSDPKCLAPNNFLLHSADYVKTTPSADSPEGLSEQAAGEAQVTFLDPLQSCRTPDASLRESQRKSWSEEAIDRVCPQGGSLEMGNLNWFYDLDW